MNKKNVDDNLLLRARALQLRIDSIRSTTASRSGHPTTCLSAADIISALFFHTMNFDVEHHDAENNDRFILSKGHGVPVVYAAYKQLGVLSDDELMQLRTFDSPLEGHPTPRFPYNEAATGSLGQGLAIGVGMAINAKMDKKDYMTYVLLGDGELAEGSIWEAASCAAHYTLHNLVGIVDCNRLGQTGGTLYGHDCQKYANKFNAFGWNTVMVDGHNVDALVQAFDRAKEGGEKPTVIIAKTYKGYGVDAFEDKNGFHGKPVKESELEHIISSLKQRFPSEAEYLSHHDIIAPKREKKGSHAAKKSCRAPMDLSADPHRKLFSKGESLATRKAFGYALAALGRTCSAVVGLDADVKNSTFTQIFEDEFPDRFVQCFIAEQTMIGVATGLEARGKIPFAATFGAFITRAHDQIRMAGVGRNALRICGSHCGVSIGEDGPSQMGLEDISLMRSIRHSIVLYPSDAVSTYYLVEKMALYDEGMSYIRTTRSATPVLYDNTEKFEVGGCKVLRRGANDRVCIVAAGITLYEAITAYGVLKERGIEVSVIDAYSIKPLDSETIISVALASGGKILTVEDHYIEGGLGEAVASALSEEGGLSVCMLAVREISRSASAKKLMAYAGIDSAHIVAKVIEMCG